MALKINSVTKNMIQKIPCPYEGKTIAKGEVAVEHITKAITKPETYPFSKEELNSRLEKITKQIKQNPDDINLRKYYDVLKRII